MNKRRRAILDALAPAVEFAMCRECRDRDAAGPAGLNFKPRLTADAPAELLIYGRIGGGGFFSDGISANDVAAALKDAGPGPLNVRINSGGGDVFDGVAIHSLLARHSGTVTVYVDGLAASAASFIMLAGDRVIAARNSMIMVHDAMTLTFGAAASHQRAIDLLAKVSDNIADMYAEKAGEDVAHWRAIMTENGEDGVWYTGSEALDKGLVDEITGQDDVDEPDRTEAFLAGWLAVLPQEVATRVENRVVARDDDPVPASVLWDGAAFANMMKEVIA